MDQSKNAFTELIRFYAMWGEAYITNFVLPYFDYMREVREMSNQDAQAKKEN
jgi:hypothetical protein